MNAEVEALRKKIEKVETDLYGSLTPQTKQKALNDLVIIFRDASNLVGKMTDEIVLMVDPDKSAFEEEDPLYVGDILHRAQLLKDSVKCLP